MKFFEQIKLAKSTKQIHSTWYCQTYPEVAELGLDPATHYVRYGAEMGRNPGKNFNTQFYLDTYPEVRKSKLNPLVHYALHGQKAGYATRPHREEPRKQINVIRTKLLSLGFTERPLAELTEIANASANPEARAMAARELALWHMRAKTETDYRTALDWIARARPDAPDLDFRSKLSTVELLCHYHLNDHATGLAAYERAALAGEVTPDLTLARVNYEQTPENRVLWINQVLARYDIEPVTLLPDEGQPAYDRLTCAVNLQKVMDGPKVTVLIAAYDAAKMLPTALRSLQEQTWQNLEIIVLDDCSPTPDTMRVAEQFAAHDPRIQVVRMEQNGGAYVARNRGLDIATGEFVTLHDADDWSHPKKIETQVRFMMENSQMMGCMSQQARITPDLFFAMLRSNGGFIIANMSSFFWRRQPVCSQLGYWDTVRFGADSEFIKRVKIAFGDSAVAQIDNAILSFQREAYSSITADEHCGLDSRAFGIRKEYHELQAYAHEHAESLKYTNDRAQRPFPVPAIMTHQKSAFIKSSDVYDLVIYADLRDSSDHLPALVDLITQQPGRIGLVAVAEYDLSSKKPLVATAKVIRGMVHQGKATILSYGMAVRARETRYFSRPDALQAMRYLPNVAVLETEHTVNMKRMV